MTTINSFLCAFLIIYVLSSALDIFIDIVNAAKLKKEGMKVPRGFEGIVNEDKLIEINAYTIDNTKLSVIRSITGKIVFLAIILSGFLPWLSDTMKDFYFIWAGLIFFAIPGLIGAVVDLPFDYYHNFTIEERYGFNTSTRKTWCLDLLKSLIITIILGGILLSSLLLMVGYAGNKWWIWSWLIFFLFQLLITILYPTVIAPLFNKFVPIEDHDLEKDIRELAEREGLNVKGIFQMDAARRSRHTNAYFSGLGKTKRIVLFDTLLKAHSNDEILAVLAHEIGHLKKGHIKKQFIMVSIASFVLFFAASKMITWNTLYGSFGFSSTPLYAGLFLIPVIWEPVGFFISPLAMAVSRRYERESDRYAYKIMKSAVHLINALKKMTLDNLANLFPHPLYVFFNYSHPPITERIKILERMEE
jgi:STE24 endopeptidase